MAEDLLDQFVAQLEQLERTPPRSLVIRSVKDNGFIAGADVRAFSPMASRELALALIQRGQQAFDRLAALPFPTLALIHGFCLGGGLELARACLRENVVADVDLLDAGMIFATDFAPFRGGPLHHALLQGDMVVYRELQKLTGRHGPRFTPDLGWNQNKG